MGAALDEVAVVTDSLTALAAPGNPLDLLSLRQFLIFVAKAHGRSMSALAEVLRISRETVYAEMQAAAETLRPVPTRQRPPVTPILLPDGPPAYHCRAHPGGCSPGCPRLGRFVARFNRAHPVR